MTTPSENDHASHDPADRLLDTALAELIGGTAPTDLSSRIAAATSRQPAAIGQGPRTRQDRAFWVNPAVAVMLLIGVTVVLVPAFRNSREPAGGVVANATKTGNKVADLVDEFN